MSFCLTFWLMTPVAAFLSLWSDKLCCKSLQCQELAPHGASDQIWTQLSKQTNSFIWHHYNNILTSLNTLLSLSHSSIKHLHLASILSLALKASPTVKLFFLIDVAFSSRWPYLLLSIREPCEVWIQRFRHNNPALNCQLKMFDCDRQQILSLIHSNKNKYSNIADNCVTTEW